MYNSEHDYNAATHQTCAIIFAVVFLPPLLDLWAHGGHDKLRRHGEGDFLTVKHIMPLLLGHMAIALCTMSLHASAHNAVAFSSSIVLLFLSFGIKLADNTMAITYGIKSASLLWQPGAWFHIGTAISIRGYMSALELKDSCN